MESRKARRRAFASFLLATFFLSFSTHALEVAFIKLKLRSGEPVILEPGVPYSHVAISFGGAWLHASPHKGVVELAWSLENIGEPHAILRDADEPELDLLQVLPLIGLPYDSEYDWESGDRLYCSELVAKLLGIPPQPMTFDASLWPARFLEKNGKPGLSPSDLYKELQQKGFVEESVDGHEPIESCEHATSVST